MWNENFELLDKSFSVSEIKIILSILSKKQEIVIANPPIKMCANKIENRITLKIKRGYYHKFVTAAKMKLHGCTKSKKTQKNKNKQGENVPHLEITEVVLM